MGLGTASIIKIVLIYRKNTCKVHLFTIYPVLILKMLLYDLIRG